jgi:hypothetical protein
VKRDDGVTPVVRAAEELRQLGLSHLLDDSSDLARRLAERVFALLIFGHVNKKSRLFQIGAMLFPTVENVFEARLFFENGLRLVSVVPKIRLGD